MQFLSRAFFVNVLIAGGYVFAAELGHLVAIAPGTATAIWPASGIALVALLLGGTRNIPGVFLGAWIGSLIPCFRNFIDHGIWGVVFVSGWMAMGGLLQAGVGAALVRQFGPPSLKSVRSVVALIALGGAFSCLISASVGVLVLSSFGVLRGDEIRANWLTWYLGDTCGVLATAPLILGVFEEFRSGWNWKARRAWWLEALGLIALETCVGLFVFGVNLEGSSSNLALGVLCLPVLVVVVLRVGVLANSVSLFALSSVAAFMTVRGSGPFSHTDFALSLLQLQVFIATLTWTSLLLGAALEERQVAQGRLTEARNALEVLVADRTRELEGERSFIQTLSETIGALVIVLDPEGRVIQFNRACEELTGYRAEDIRGQAFLDLLVSEGEGDRVLAAFEELRKTGGPVPYEGYWVTRHGRRHWIAWSNTLLRSPDGGVRLILGTGIDLTRWKQAEEALRRSQRQYHDLMESIDGIVWEADAETFRFTFVSPQAERILGYPLSRWYKDPTFWVDRMHPEDVSWAPQFCKDQSMNGLSHDFEYRMYRSDGQLIWIRDIVSVVMENGRPTLLRGIMLDVTDKKAYLTEAENARQVAENAVRLRDEFISIASHELKTPLTPLKLHLDTLKLIYRDGKLEAFPREQLNRFFEIADTQMYRLKRLVDDLLDVSRITSGKLNLCFERTSLSTLVHEVVERYQSDIVAAHCDFRVEAEGEACGNWDRMRVEQVVVNLITNAMKYGKGKPVRLKVSSSEEWACLEVSDQGIGIAPQDQERIFNRFERAASSRHFGGLGLGLYISRQIAEAHSGRIRVSSRIGEGSSFVLELPHDPPVAVMSSDRIPVAG